MSTDIGSGGAVVSEGGGSGRKEEERNEKIIRGLLKLPPNRRCINCNSLGPQYVCTNFWTFICITCSGIHREFTHRVKSVSMAKFTLKEVEELQRGGNQRAREKFLKGFDMQQNQGFPNCSNVDQIREFVKIVYVEKKYWVGIKSSAKPPIDIHSCKNVDGEDIRRASSYHSYSQSPPYENQYEDRRNGKQQQHISVLTREPGSDRGGSKFLKFFYTSGRTKKPIHDRFSNEGFSQPRFSDCSVLGVGTKHLSLGNFFEMKLESQEIPRSEISDDSNSGTLKSVNSDSLIDEVLKSEHANAIQNEEPVLSFTLSSSLPSSPSSSSELDLFGLSFVEQSNGATDLSAKNTVSVPLPEIKGHAAFDVSDMRPETICVGGSSVTHNPFVEETKEVSIFGNSTTSWTLFDDSLPKWTTFDDCIENDETSFGSFPLKHLPPSNINLSVSVEPIKKSEVLNSFQMPIMKSEVPNPFHIPISTTAKRIKSSNPFDLPFDSDFEYLNTFSDKTCSKNTIPNPQFLNPFGSDISEPWFYSSPSGISQSSCPSSIQNNFSSSQVPVAPVGGNPFA
ncbi:putative ADP-ribosylation factor GTPase-activating protein AGD14 [Zostera marina]|uniref:Putative ADP-ribosylation factor GTPase-activating protein AGD14 n=1 Tax=Zostera marina TaxID=29655 RepID=A0A0K9NNS5_ZOSMR|nr:putative ADP-ribosylation factor GTPase-activating protein AGD14 [Zostera marina]